MSVIAFAFVAALVFVIWAWKPDKTASDEEGMERELDAEDGSRRRKSKTELKD